jgi:uncharacterized protein YggE
MTMKTLACLAALAGAAFALPVAAQDLGIDEPSIVVIGTGFAEAPPDRFRIRATAQGQGQDQLSALRALAANQDRVTDGLKRLEGVTAGAVTNAGVSVSPTFDPDCEGARYGGDGAACPITGYTATTELVFEGAPVERAGDAVSLASQLGARQASILEMRLADDSALKAAAGRQAFADARRQADMLAQASGQRIVRVLRVQQTDDRMGLMMEYAAAEAAAAPAVQVELIRPEVAIAVAPEPARAHANLVVVFEIE